MPLGRFRVNRNSELTGEKQGSRPGLLGQASQGGSFGPGLFLPQGLSRFLPGGNMPPMPPGLERFIRRRGFQAPMQSGSPTQQPVSPEVWNQPKKKGIKDLLSRFGMGKKS
ncbi:MAG: hypothetical protein QMC95_14560 [Desulfitobacteriaceae bacterium]|nr:hypothetical protein [Desulfitobacteriaceae bacterium]MDI6915416.1 hypothetical protein [Desulfitobacteriaceae bacterium]